MVQSLQIAIDGPIGSGKSTVAKGVSKRLGLLIVDAGALYRTATFLARREQLRPDHASLIAEKFRNAVIVERMPNEKEQDGRKITVLLDGEDISWAIRTHEIDDFVAKFAEHREIMEVVWEKERNIAHAQGVVIEGREIGTMVLPGAQVKVYLTADIKQRANRRFQEYQRHGDTTPKHEIIRALRERDELDMRRAYAPLRKAEDAVLIDTTNRTVDQVVDEIVQLVPKAYKKNDNGG